MDHNQRPIAWSALARGTPVRASDGEEIGKVTQVIADEQKDIFSGLTFRPRLIEAERFVPADLIDELTTDAVCLTISAAEADELGAYEA